MRTFFWLFIYLLSFDALGQEKGDIGVKIIEGELFKTEHKKLTVVDRVSDNQGGGYLFLDGGYGSYKNFIIQHINADLEIDLENKLDFGKERILSKFLIDNTLHIITGVTDSGTKEAVFKSHYTKDFGNTFITKTFLRIPLSTFGVEIGFDRFIDFIRPSFQEDKGDDGFKGWISFSENKNFFSLSFDRSETDTSEHLIYVFDKELDIVYRQTYKSDTKERKHKYIDGAISDKDGTVYYLSRITTKESFLRGVRAYEFEILTLRKDKVSVTNFKNDGISYGTLRLVLDRDEQSLKAVGTYSEKSEGYDDGVVFVSFNMDDLNLYETKLSPFSKDFLELKFGNKKNKELKHYFLKGILQRDNGNFVMTSEELRVVDRSNEFGQVNSPYYYHFKDILIAEISSDGTLIKANNINKHQEISNLARLPIASYSSFINGENTYLIFNAQKIKEKKNKANLFIGTSLIPHRTFIVKIDGLGKVIYEQIEKSEIKMLFAIGQSMFTTHNNENVSNLILQGQTMNKRQFIKLDFTE